MPKYRFSKKLLFVPVLLALLCLNVPPDENVSAESVGPPNIARSEKVSWIDGISASSSESNQPDQMMEYEHVDHHHLESYEIFSLSSLVGDSVQVIATDPADGVEEVSVDKSITVSFNEYISPGPNFLNITVHSGQHFVSVTSSVYENELYIIPNEVFDPGVIYVVTIPEHAVQNESSLPNESIQFTFKTAGEMTPPAKPVIVLSTEDWTHQDVLMTITHENIPGLRSQYRIGSDGIWTDYVGPVTISSEGETQVFARTVDKFGNVSEAAAALVKIDRTPPEAPAGLKKTQVAKTNVDIAWSASADNVEVIKYKIYNEGILLGEVPGTQVNLTGLVPAQIYRFTVTAVDKAGNESAHSRELMVSTYQQPAYFYDPAGSGRLDRVVYEDGTTVKFLYDANGNLIQTYLQSQ